MNLLPLRGFAEQELGVPSMSAAMSAAADLRYFLTSAACDNMFSHGVEGAKRTKPVDIRLTL